MGQILVRVEQLKKGVGGRTLLVVEGSFRKRPDVASPRASHRPSARQVRGLAANAASKNLKTLMIILSALRRAL